MSDLRFHICGDAGWWEYDARGIPLVKVCEQCREAKRSMFRREVLENPDYEADEQIEEEVWS